MIPFVYVIVSHIGQVYVGSRYAVDAHPRQLLTTYFTSSRFVQPLAKKHPEQWRVERLQIVATPSEAIALESEWQHEYKGCPGFMNRRIINKEFIFDSSGSNNPMSAKWIFEDPTGKVYEQPENVTAADFISGLGHSVQMLMKYRKLGKLPRVGSFAGWKILSCTRGKQDLLNGIIFRPKIQQSKKRKPLKTSRRGTPEYSAEVALRNKQLDSAARMHNVVSWKKISKSKRAISVMCTGPYEIKTPTETLIVEDLLDFADSNSLARNTIRYLLKTGVTAKQGPCKGISIRRCQDV